MKDAITKEDFCRGLEKHKRIASIKDPRHIELALRRGIS